MFHFIRVLVLSKLFSNAALRTKILSWRKKSLNTVISATANFHSAVRRAANHCENDGESTLSLKWAQVYTVLIWSPLSQLWKVMVLKMTRNMYSSDLVLNVQKIVQEVAKICKGFSIPHQHIIYHISYNRCLSIYFFHDTVDPVLKQGQCFNTCRDSIY